MKKKFFYEKKLNDIFSYLAKISLSLNCNCKKIVLFKMSLIFLLILGFFISTIVIFKNNNTISAQTSPDAIAIRVIPNPNNYSPERWYNEQSFSGSPQLTTVDGYQAVRDGRTVYVNAANIDLNNGTCSHDASMPCVIPGGTAICDAASSGSICRPSLYTNIYLISYNQDAENETIDIFGRILKSWMFNTNIAGTGSCSTNSDCTGTVGCWLFNGDFLDYSVNNYQSTENGGVIFVNGIKGKAAQFDGQDDWILLDGFNNGNYFYKNNKDVSFSAWIKGTGGYIYSEARNSIQPPWAVIRDGGGVGVGGKLSIQFFDNNWSGANTVSNRENVFDDNWRYVVVTDDASEVNIYIDGALDLTYTYVRPPMGGFSSINQAAIGAFRRILPQGFFKGLIDEVKIYDRILSPSEITAEYDSIIKCQTDDDCLGQGYCDSFKARITRDVLRLSDFTDVDTNMDNYKRINNKYPILDSGTYLTNKTISAWPSWAQNLSSELGSPIPVDPINELGSCAGTGYDPDTCWDEVTKSFADPTPSNGQFNLPNNSYAYVYESLANGDQYNLCANMETGAMFNNIAVYNCAGNVINNNDPVITKVNIPQGTEGAPYRGYIEAIDPDGDILTWTIDTTPGIPWTNWTIPVIQSAGVFNQREISSGQVGDIGSYNFKVTVDDGRGGIAICDSTNGCTISVVAGATCTDNDTDGFGYPASPTCPKGNILDCDDNDGANYPGNTEDCSTTTDNDCDGLAGCLDPDCFNDPICPASCNDGNCEVSRGECSMACATSDCQSVDCCGDGNVDLPMSEECDDGNTITNDACNSCVKTFCGDGIIQDNPENGDFIKEKCDDGNTVPGDGCDDDCQVESFFNFCVPGSGDGICPLGCLPEDDPDCGCLSDGWCGRMCTSVIGDFLYDEDCNLSCGKPTVACGGVLCCDPGEDCVSCSADCGYCGTCTATSTIALNIGINNGLVYDNNNDAYSSNNVAGGTYLKLISSMPAPYIWIANSNINMVSKMRTYDGLQRDCTGSYPNVVCQWVAGTWETRGQTFGPYPVGTNPSRTAVNAETGEVWIANRDSGGVSKLSINGNPVKTCPTGGGPRGVAIEQNGDVWVANYSDGNVKKISGDDSDCTILATVNTGGNPYGLAIDGDNNIWVANRGAGSIQKINTSNNTLAGTFSTPGIYGITVDKFGNVWGGNWGGGDGVYKIPYGSATVISYPTGYGQTGITADINGDIWASAMGNGRVIKINQAGAVVLDLPSGGVNPHGICGDSSGQIWSVNLGSNNTRVFDLSGNILTLDGVDPNAVPGDVYCVNDVNGNDNCGDDGIQPYTYSDMTGLNRAMLLRSGDWVAGAGGVFDSGFPGQHWGSVSWQEVIPGLKQSIEVFLRASDDPNFTLGPSWIPATQWNNYQFMDPKREGRYLQTRVILRSNESDVTPVLWDLKINCS